VKAIYIIRLLVAVSIICMMSAASCAQAFPSSIFQSSLDGLPSFLQPSIAQYSLPDTGLSLSSPFGSSATDNSSYFPGLSDVLGSEGLSSQFFSFPDSLGSNPLSGLTSGQPISSLGSLDLSNLMAGAGQDQVNQVIDSYQPSAVNNYTEADNGRTIYISLGDTIHVELTSRVDEGFLWNLSVTNGLNITGSRMYPPVQSDMDLLAGVVGFNETEEWDIQAIAPGTQTISGVCCKSGNASLEAVNRYELTVVVSG